MPTVRRARAGTDRRCMARQLADRHTAHSQRYTSCRPPTPTHNIYYPPSAARRCADYCRRRYCSSSEAALRGARTNTRRALWVLVQRRALRTHSLSYPLLYFYNVGLLQIPGAGCVMCMRSARFSRTVSSSLVGSERPRGTSW